MSIGIRVAVIGGENERVAVQFTAVPTLIPAAPQTSALLTLSTTSANSSSEKERLPIVNSLPSGIAGDNVVSVDRLPEIVAVQGPDCI